MQLELVMSGMKDIESDTVRNVTLYLCYNSAETRPYKLLPDTNDNEKPSAELFKRLNKYFKPFLKNDLSSAFQCVNESQTEFLWKPIATDENGGKILETSDESLENAGFLSTCLRRDNKKQKRNKNKEQNEKSASHDNEAETSLRAEEEECEDIDVKKDKKRNDFSGDDKKINPRKYKRLAKRAKLIGSSDGLRESEREVSHTEKSNELHDDDESNKPESKVTSATSRVQRRKTSKKPQTNVENPWTHNDKDNVLSKSNNNQENVLTNINGKRRRIQNRELVTKSNDLDCEDAKSSQETQKRRKVITQVEEDKGEDKRNRMIPNRSKQNRQSRINVSSSTPLNKKLPDKRKFFHVSRISEIL